MGKNCVGEDDGAVRKIFLLLLFFIFFSLSGFATTTEQQLYEQKYQLEQQKEQIKGLEDELKIYTDDKVEDSNKRVEIINGSVDRFTGVVTILGIGLPIILFLIGWFSAKNTAKKETQEFLNEWVKTKADIDFKELAKEKLNVKLMEFETKANSQLNEFETKHEAELNLIRQQVKTTDEKQDAQGLFNKAYRLGQEEKYDEEIKVYNELIVKYKDSILDRVQELVAYAMFNKAVRLEQLDKSEEAIEIYDALIAFYRDLKLDAIHELIEMAIVSKYERMIIQKESLSKVEKQWIVDANRKTEDKASFGLLNIIENAKNASQDQEVKKWIDDYKDIKIKNWNFKELRKWIANSSHNEEVKNRINDYIDIFEKHLHRD